MEIVRRISNLDSFIEWAETYRHLLTAGQYRSAFKRQYVEIGWRCEKGVYTKALDDERAFAIAERSGCPDAKIFLLCLYQRGGGIKEHRDDTGYGKVAYGLSSTDYEFIHNGNHYHCEAGTIYKFNSKQPHSVPPVAAERWALLWWEPDWKYWSELGF